MDDEGLVHFRVHQRIKATKSKFVSNNNLKTTFSRTRIKVYKITKKLYHGHYFDGVFSALAQRWQDKSH